MLRGQTDDDRPITIAVLAFYYGFDALSTLTNDVSRLELFLRRGGGSVPATTCSPRGGPTRTCRGAFTRNPRDSWAFNLHQTAQKVVVVFLTGRLRHEPLHLSALLIAWASWVAATAVVFRPYLSSSFCRLQLVLRALVLYSMIWSAVLLAVGTKDDTSSLVLSLSFILTVPSARRWCGGSHGSSFRGTRASRRLHVATRMQRVL